MTIGSMAADRAANACLHLVAGASAAALEDCLAHIAPGDSVLFLDAGVLHLLRANRVGWVPDGVAVQFAVVDLRAHGLLDLAARAGVPAVDDPSFCALLSAHRHCLTWT